MQSICAALSYAHQSGIVHCDLKTSNILMDKNGHVYVSDFGIARQAEASTSTLLGSGSPPYMAPEQFAGDMLTSQTDIYALGVVMYEMLSGGYRPYDGDRAQIQGAIYRRIAWEHQYLEPLPVRQFNPSISPAQEAVLQRCLQRDPRLRFNDMNEVYQLLAQGTRVERSQPVNRNPHPQTRFEKSEKPEKHSSQDSRRSFAVVAVIIILALVMVLYLVIRHSIEQASSSRLKPTEPKQAMGEMTDIPSIFPTSTISPLIADAIPEDISAYDWQCLYELQSGDMLYQVLPMFAQTYDSNRPYYSAPTCEIDIRDERLISCSDKEKINNTNMLLSGQWLLVFTSNPGNPPTDLLPEECIAGGGKIQIDGYQPLPTAEPDPTAAPAECDGVINQNAYIFSENDKASEQIHNYLRPGEQVRITGHDETFGFYYVEYETKDGIVEGWVSAGSIDQNADCPTIPQQK